MSICHNKCTPCIKKRERNFCQKQNQIKVYDKTDTSSLIDQNDPLRLQDLDIELPAELPAKVISLKLPNVLLNKLQAYASEKDIPYSSLIRMILSKEMDKKIPAD
ncbi:MAG: BrnA antitoxin family protein [Candidatus Cloacimonetes bacterium]|nr:BrnA antitoxin family protein [Candidatus Cloacimonadota bacterium]